MGGVMSIGRAAVICCLILARGVHADWQTDTQDIMGTEVNVTLWHSNAKLRRQALGAAMTEMRRLDHALSPYIASSALAQVNAQAARRPVAINGEFYRLLQRAIYYGDLTQGAFDITFASLGWHFDYRNKQQPDTKQTQDLLPAINYRGLRLNAANGTVGFGHKNVRIDLGGIAKGYAVDRAAKILQNLGIKHATVSAGGDSRMVGDKRGKPWLIGIKNPRLHESRDRRKSVLTLPLENTAISTSGDYERYFLDETGARIHHIINPKNGKPVKGVISVTVIGPNGLDTDALSTSVFVMGVAKGISLINTLEDFDCIIISDDGVVHYSDGLVEPITG